MAEDKKGNLPSKDYQFADALDTCCENCAAGQGNQLQKTLLRTRGVINPEEKEVVDALNNKCDWCKREGKEETESISATLSCLYRGKHE